MKSLACLSYLAIYRAVCITGETEQGQICPNVSALAAPVEMLFVSDCAVLWSSWVMGVTGVEWILGGLTVLVLLICWFEFLLLDWLVFRGWVWPLASVALVGVGPRPVSLTHASWNIWQELGSYVTFCICAQSW